MMGVLKPKGMVKNRWCCYYPYQMSTKSLSDVYQDISYEEVQKYGSRDVTESSLVSSRSKGGLAGRWAATFQIRNQNHLLITV